MFDRSDERMKRLYDIVDANSLLRGDFTLTSGRKSTFLFQMRQTTLHPEGSWLLGDLIVDYMKEQGLKGIGGLVLGAAPMVSAVGVMSHAKGYPVNGFYVRKEAKQHGAKELINGYIKEGEEVLVVDDVTTTGGSTLKAAQVIRENGCPVTKALSIVDREEGGTELLGENGLELVSMFRKSDFNIG